jgi:hypothetical protein
MVNTPTGASPVMVSIPAGAAREESFLAHGSRANWIGDRRRADSEERAKECAAWLQLSTGVVMGEWHVGVWLVGGEEEGSEVGDHKRTTR